jgi:hypothetical protein
LKTLEQIAKEKDQKEIFNLKDKIMETWAKRLSEKRSGIHISDLLHCKRQSAFRTLDSEPTIPNEATVRNLLVCESCHRAIQAILGTEEYDHEKPITWTSKKGVRIHATPDVVHKASGVIFELKTTSATRVMKQAYSNHIEQLKIYLALLNAPYGKLFYIVLGSGTDDSYFKEYLVELKPGERQKILAKLERDAEEFQRGIREKNPAHVSHMADKLEYLNSLGENWICKSCKHQSRCLEMRVEEWKRQIETA